MSCRVAMLRMHEDDLVCLPPPRKAKPEIREIEFTQATAFSKPIIEPVQLLPPLSLQIVDRKRSALWNEYIHRYHYLGYTPLPGAQLRYFITVDDQVVALTGFGAAAWQTAPRDGFIGWDREQRERHG